MSRLFERLVTDRTSMRAFIAVSTSMRDTRGEVSEALTAQLTSVRFVVSVTAAFVSVEDRRAVERFVAQVAREWFFSGVYDLVVVERGFVDEGFVTEGALVGGLAGVHAFVEREALGTRELLVALVAVVGFDGLEQARVGDRYGGGQEKVQVFEGLV